MIRDIKRLESLMPINGPKLPWRDEVIQSIAFAHAELGIEESYIPSSIKDIEELNNELVAMLPPPPGEQMVEFDRNCRHFLICVIHGWVIDAGRITAPPHSVYGSSALNEV